MKEELKNDGGTPAVTTEKNPIEQGSDAQLPTAEGEVGQRKKTKKEAEEKDFKPTYSNEKKKELEVVTKVCEEEINRVQADPTYAAVSFGNGENAVIDLRTAFKKGVNFCTPLVNRKHGKDQVNTGESLLSYGPQHPMIVITSKMADAAGMEYTTFDGKKETSDNALVFNDGNGRIAYLLGVEPEKWPAVYAVFPSKDACGYFNIPKAMEVINTQVSVWKTQDMVQKRLLEEGNKAHEGWSLINDLVKKGYMYQAACQLVTLGTDRIVKRDVTGGQADIIFSHYDSAVKVYEALKARIGEGDDKTLKTKAFTKEVSVLWGKLQKKGGDDTATTNFVEFIGKLDKTKVEKIKAAKADKSKGTTKDGERIKILDEEFYKFVGAKNLTID